MNNAKNLYKKKGNRLEMGWGTVLLANLQNCVTKKFPNVQVPMRDFNQLFRFKVMNSILSGSNDLMNLLNDNDLWAIGGVDLENKGTYIKMRLAKRGSNKELIINFDGFCQKMIAGKVDDSFFVNDYVRASMDLRNLAEVFMEYDIIEMIDPKKGPHSSKAVLRTYTHYSEKESFKGSFDMGGTNPWHMTGNFIDFIATSPVFKRTLDLSSPNNYLQLSKDQISKADQIIVPVKIDGVYTFEVQKMSVDSPIRISSASYTAYAIYRDIFRFDSADIPECATDDEDGRLMYGDLREPLLQQYLWTGEISLSSGEKVKFADEHIEDVKIRAEYLKNMQLSLKTVLMSINGLKFQLQHQGKNSKYVIWDVFDQLLRVLPNDGSPVSFLKGNFKSPETYYLKLYEIAIALESYFTVEMADNWMAWMTNDQFDISNWRSINTADLYKARCQEVFSSTESDLRWLLLSDRRNVSAAKDFVDKMEFLGYIGRDSILKDPFNSGIVSIETNKWKELENTLHHLIEIISKKEDVNLFCDGFLSDISYGLKMTTDDDGNVKESYVNLYYQQFVIMDYLAQIITNCFGSKTQLQAFLQKITHDVKITDDMDPLFLPDRDYTNEKYFDPYNKDVSTYMLTNPFRLFIADFNINGYATKYKNAGVKKINFESSDGTQKERPIAYLSENEKKFITAISAHSSTHSVGCPKSFIQSIAGDELIGLCLRRIAPHLVLSRPRVDNTFYSGTKFFYSDKTTRSYKILYYDYLIKLFGGNVLHHEIIGFGLRYSLDPLYFYKKDQDCLGFLSLGFAPTYSLGTDVLLNDYSKNSHYIGKSAPLFTSDHQKNELFDLMQILMQDENTWINDGGTMRPLTVKEVLLTFHTNFEAWGTTAPFAANIQKVFGIDATTYQINAAMAQWWINFESFGSSSILLHGKQTVNQAFYHNQLVASIYN